MSIPGISIEKSQDYLIVHVKTFSRELRQLIRDQLSGIYHGFAEVESQPDFYSYRNTLASFLERYNTKSENIKKGMIGELLAHVLVNALSTYIRCLSVYKNKEERSIKKGFDIIYYHQKLKNLWYTEVKSGRSMSRAVSSDAYNLKLLQRSRDSILEMFKSKRNDLWQSAIIDVMLTMEPGTKQRKMKDLLVKDAATITGPVKKRNVILVSVLYHSLSDMVTPSEIKTFQKKITGENVFEKALVLCIQKETYERVADFLTAESKNS